MLPRFTVEMGGRPVATIRKEFSFMRPKFSIDSPGLSIQGDWWDDESLEPLIPGPVAHLSAGT